MRKAKTIDGYLSTLSAERRAPLDQLRRTLRSLVPKAEECISYGIPAFRLDGKVVGGFAATKKGILLFPVQRQHARHVVSRARSVRADQIGAAFRCPVSPQGHVGEEAHPGAARRDRSRTLTALRSSGGRTNAG